VLECRPRCPGSNVPIIAVRRGLELPAESCPPTDFWDPIKYVRLRDDIDDWYASVGGEVREAWERIGNDNWGQQPIQNAFFLQRYMAHADIHYGKHFRTFVQLKSGIETFR
jgi:hypothetical protein